MLPSTSDARRRIRSLEKLPTKSLLCLGKTQRPSTTTSLRHGQSNADAADRRQLPGYTKLKKLGVGGCGTVWQVQAVETSARFALKQIPKHASGLVSGLVEVKVGLRLFPQADVVREKLLERSCAAATQPSGDNNRPPHIIQLYKVVETKQDLWLLFEQGGETLHNALFDIKGEFHQGSRSYKITHRPLYLAMRDNVSLLKDLLRQLVQAVATLSAVGIVHADIKPDNILIGQAARADHSLQLMVKLIDFGSAFSASSPRLSSARTPEYVPPDILELVRTKHEPCDVKAYFASHCLPHSFDMWSVGCVFLEIVCGVPLWFSYKSRVTGWDPNRSVTGLLSASGRDPDKIAHRQLHVVEHLTKCIRDSPGMNVDSKRWLHGVDLLERMLSINPSQRIAPDEALRHPFLHQSD
ncbi:hypothetical protein LEN26_013731 [Aphanomyces euteiches]|nr:hypothetical protein AeMF1_020320 [Aphanomyces euteiches]KAH9110554.1 hypothetical protein LEN26_013731 [Aphanomyces euteiches]KAH9196307.1 hypothetical protein AeNC1_001737 [Aphanomyces euteiches]